MSGLQRARAIQSWAITDLQALQKDIVLLGCIWQVADAVLDAAGCFIEVKAVIRLQLASPYAPDSIHIQLTLLARREHLQDSYNVSQNTMDTG